MPTGSPRVSEVVADVAALHADPANQGAFFQVVSQFNLLEMVSPSVAFDRHRDAPLDIRIVSYGGSNPDLRPLLRG